MPVIVRVQPIVPGGVDEWRAFVSELTGTRRVEWAESHRRRGISRQVVSLVESPNGPLSVVLLEASDPEAADRLLRESTVEFDVWLVGNLDALLGDPMPAEMVFDTTPRRGPWRGLRRPGARP